MSSTSSVVSTAPSVEIPQLNLKHSINKHVQYHGIVRGIVQKIEDEIPELQNLKLNPEFFFFNKRSIKKLYKTSARCAEMQGQQHKEATVSAIEYR